LRQRIWNMIFDAHVHVGYYSRLECSEPWYYSPQRVLGVLDRCRVNEFAVSSTCAQVASIRIRDLSRETREMKRRSGGRAHVFLWVSAHVLAQDPGLKVLDCGLYEGIKLHELETPWARDRPKELTRLLEIADTRGLPVQFHSASSGSCRPVELSKWAKRFPNVRFDFAHCPDMPEMARVIADHPNVWTDTAYLPLDRFPYLQEYEWRGRLMFGTDLPVWQAVDSCGLTTRYRQYVKAFSDTSLDGGSAFTRYIKGDAA